MLEVIIAACLAIIALVGSYSVAAKVLHLQQEMQRNIPLLPCQQEQNFFTCEHDQIIVKDQ